MSTKTEKERLVAGIVDAIKTAQAIDANVHEVVEMAVDLFGPAYAVEVFMPGDPGPTATSAMRLVMMEQQKTRGRVLGENLASEIVEDLRRFVNSNPATQEEFRQAVLEFMCTRGLDVIGAALVGRPPGPRRPLSPRTFGGREIRQMTDAEIYEALGDIGARPGFESEAAAQELKRELEKREDMRQRIPRGLGPRFLA